MGFPFFHHSTASEANGQKELYCHLCLKDVSHRLYFSVLFPLKFVKLTTDYTGKLTQPIKIKLYLCIYGKAWR